MQHCWHQRGYSHLDRFVHTVEGRCDLCSGFAGLLGRGCMQLRQRSVSRKDLTHTQYAGQAHPRVDHITRSGAAATDVQQGQAYGAHVDGPHPPLP